MKSTVKVGLKLLFMYVTICVVIIYLSSCRMVDYYGWSATHSEGDISRGIGHETEANALTFNVGWNAGTQHKAMKNMAAVDYQALAYALRNIADMDVSNAGVVAVEEANNHPEAHTDVHIIDPNKDKELDPKADPYLSMLERILVAVIALLFGGGAAAALKRKIGTKDEPQDTTEHA